MKYLFLLICLMIPMMGNECSSPDGSVHETHSTSFQSEMPTQPVPEPSAALIFGVGLIVAGVVARQRRK